MTSPDKRIVWCLAGALALATFLAYLPALSAPFFFDDDSAILTNASIRQWSTALTPPPLLTVSGRPLLNLSLTLNHAISGDAPWSYHALNVVIHLLAGLTLFGLVRRTAPLVGRGLSPTNSQGASLSGVKPDPQIAFVVALLWLLHPLQTEAITYVVQRAESLMGLCYLLTLYCFVRATERHPIGDRWWRAAAVGACLAGMATKEVMASAPLLVLLYDRTFIAGSFAAAWRARRGFYLALASTWLLLAGLVLGTAGRGGTAGFDTDISAWSYALTQLHAIALYLKLSLWPQPLVFDYGTVVAQPADVWLPAVLLIALGAGMIVALRRRHVAGYLGALFFLVLAPTSSVMPIATQTIAEHRMYLSLAAPIVLVVTLAHARIGRAALAAGLAVALAGGVLTWQRNQTYCDDLTLWTDTAAKMPESHRAHYNLAVALARAGRKPEAIAHYTTAVRIDPLYVEAYNNRGVLLAELDRPAEALDDYTRAVQIDPGNPEAQNNLGYALVHADRIADGLSHLMEALRLRPDYPGAHNNIGEALAQSGRAQEALAHFEAAIRGQPNYAEAHNNFGAACLQLGRTAEAIDRFKVALRLRPDLADAHANLALALLQTGQLSEAAAQYAAVLRSVPGEISALNNLGYIALQQGRADEAVRHYQAVATLLPADAGTHYNLGVALARAARWREAVAAFEAALRLQPDYREAREQLAAARAKLKL